MNTSIIKGKTCLSSILSYFQLKKRLTILQISKRHQSMMNYNLSYYKMLFILSHTEFKQDESINDYVNSFYEQFLNEDKSKIDNFVIEYLKQYQKRISINCADNINQKIIDLTDNIIHLSIFLCKSCVEKCTLLGNKRVRSLLLDGKNNTLLILNNEKLYDTINAKYITSLTIRNIKGFLNLNHLLIFIEKLKNLKEIHIYNNNFTFNQTIKIYEVLSKNCMSIKKITIDIRCNYKITNQDIATVNKYLKNLKELKQINLYSQKIDQTIVIKLLSSFDKLSHLVLSHVTNEYQKILSLDMFPNLKYLSITEYNEDTEFTANYSKIKTLILTVLYINIKNVINIISQCSNLEVLELSFEKVNKKESVQMEEINQLLKAICLLKKLRRLKIPIGHSDINNNQWFPDNFQSNSITDLDIQFSQKVSLQQIINKFQNIKNIKIHYCLPSQYTIQNETKEISNNRINTNILKISLNKYPKDYIISTIEILPSFINLSYLSLKYCYISCYYLKKIMSSLKHFILLKKLSLVGISNDSDYFNTEEFSNELSLCKSLIKVVLREDRINDIGVDLICKKIQLLPMLQILDLGNNTMTILGMQMIKCFNQLYQNKRNVYINYRYKMHQISLRLTNIIKERFLI